MLRCAALHRASAGVTEGTWRDGLLMDLLVEVLPVATSLIAHTAG